MESSKEQHLLEIEIRNNIIHVFHLINLMYPCWKKGFISYKHS